MPTLDGCQPSGSWCAAERATLAKESGIAYSTTHKLNKEPPKGISFVTLDKLCVALKCEPGDLLVRVPGDKKAGSRGGSNSR
jgi:putative transcriptional regulator